MARTRLPCSLLALVAAAGLVSPTAPIARGQAEPSESSPPADRAPEDPKTKQPDPQTTPARVIVRESRRREVMGFVELEDSEVIVVRTLDDTIESFAKRRVVRIIRLVEPAPEQLGTVVLRNGQTRDGIIIEDTFEHVTVEIEGVRTKLKRDVVDHVRLAASFEDRLTHLKSSLGPDTPYRHLALCQWLVDERRYELAERELLELLRAHQITEAQELLRIVRAQLALRDRPASAGGLDPKPSKSPRRTLPTPEMAGGLLSREDVNLIRVFEIDFRRPPKVAVPKETIARLIQEFATSKEMDELGPDRTALYRAEPLDVVRMMFKLRARSSYPEVQVLSEPHSLNMFRQRVHNAWLMNNCATSRCHGGPDAGRFFLHRRNYHDERVRYTNLLILERLKLDEDWPLINYERPLESLIIQYGLPSNIVLRKPHPPARGWSPAFRRLEDRMVRWTVEWMEAMLHPRVEYPVQYEPPRLVVPETPPPSGEEPEETRSPR